MKPRVLALLLCTAGALSASEDVTKPAPRPRLTEALRQQVIQKSTTMNGGAAAVSTRDATPADAQYRVIESNHGIASRIDAPPPKSRPFSLVDGGDYWGRDGKAVTTELRVQYDPSLAGWDLLKLSWW
jgi:hypothetical protein